WWHARAVVVACRSSRSALRGAARLLRAAGVRVAERLGSDVLPAEVGEYLGVELVGQAGLLEEETLVGLVQVQGVEALAVRGAELGQAAQGVEDVEGHARVVGETV